MSRRVPGSNKVLRHFDVQPEMETALDSTIRDMGIDPAQYRALNASYAGAMRSLGQSTIDRATQADWLDREEDRLP